MSDNNQGDILSDHSDAITGYGGYIETRGWGRGRDMWWRAGDDRTAATKRDRGERGERDRILIEIKRE